MRYFKNKELVALYNVSDKTIRNWIASSRAGKLDLKLLEEKGRYHIADSMANNYLLEKLANRGKKYRNNRNHKDIHPSNDFYRYFNTSQVIEIANSLENYHAIPWHCAYYGEAASYWDRYLKELFKSGRPNLVTNTIETLNLSMPYIDNIIKDYEFVNIVNVCIGNNLGVRDTLSHLRATGKLKRFICLDISPDILRIGEQNMREWFGDSIVMEPHVLDIREQTFRDIMAANPYAADASKTINLIFFVCGPLVNFHNPDTILNTLGRSMNKQDLLFVSLKRNTAQTRKFFDFNTSSDKTALGGHHDSMPQILNIDDSVYVPEQVTDTRKQIRYIRLRLTKSISIHFETENYTKTVGLSRNDLITTWFAHQYHDQDVIKLHHDAGLTPISVTQSRDNQLNLLISQIKTVD